MKEDGWHKTPINCDSCDEEFLRHQYNQKTCILCLRNKDVRFNMERLVKSCKGCGKEYVRTNSPNQLFCTNQCRLDNAYLINNYGITKAEYERMLEDQGRVCWICQRDSAVVKTRMHMRLVVDHCHTSGKIRGLLCHKCNQALGLFEDNDEAIQRALEYLGRFQKV